MSLFGSNSAAAPRFYLSLGDSLATGVQPIGAPDRQFRTNEGYADQLHAIAATKLPGLETVKLGYPGESTTTMIGGGLTTYPHGSQLSEAVAFLRDHGDSVAFITLDIGFNDLPEYNLESIPVGMERIGTNLPGILGALQEAAAPGTPIVGMSIYDPFLSRWVNGPEGREQARVSVWDGVVPINTHIGEIYRAAGLRLADVEGAFATRDFETMVRVNGVGHVPANVAHVLEWTWAGTPPPLGPDFHANGRGYRVIAEEFARIVLPD